MSDQIKISKKVSIKDAGHDEYWLQDEIYKNPSILGLGDLVQVSKEKKQSSGGKLDILLKDPEDDSMYEVEVMLGETDPSHIIRSIEYWDLEKRRYQQREHFPVLIAESFERRFFHVMYLLSLNIPMIAIKVELLEVEGQRVLNFIKILDVYEEPGIEEEESVQADATQETWKLKAKWSLEAADELLRILKSLDNNLLRYTTQNYICIAQLERRPLYWVENMKEPKSRLIFRENDDKKVEAIKSILDSENIGNYYRKSDRLFHVKPIDKDYLLQRESTLKKIHNIRFPKKSETSGEDTSD